jgi:hypothetical protein
VPTQDVTNRLPLQRHGWHEYGNYVGPGSAIALVIGWLWALLRRSPGHHWFGVALAATTAFLFLLSLGEFSPTLRRHSPVTCRCSRASAFPAATRFRSYNLPR